MIYSIKFGEIKDLQNCFEYLKTFHFAYSDSMIYLNTKKSKEEIFKLIKKNTGKNSMFFVEEVTEKNVELQSPSIKSWIKDILKTEDFLKKQDEFIEKNKETLNFYNEFINFMDQELDKQLEEKSSLERSENG